MSHIEFSHRVCTVQTLQQAHDEKFSLLYRVLVKQPTHSNLFHEPESHSCWQCGAFNKTKYILM